MELTVKSQNGFKYVDEGQGPIIIMLHGMVGGPDNFKSALLHLVKDFRVVIPVLPVYEAPIRKSNVPAMTDYLHEFITMRGHSSCTLLGNSLGGHVALMYALRHPEKTSCLVLSGSAGLYENNLGTTYPKRKDYSFVKEKAALTFYEPDFASKEMIDEVYNVVNDNSRLLRLLCMARSAMKEHMGEALHRITTPTALIWGRNDKITPQDVAEEFHRLMPNSELFYIDRCGHAPMMERPKEFNAILEKYLTRILKTHVPTCDMAKPALSAAAGWGATPLG